MVLMGVLQVSYAQKRLESKWKELYWNKAGPEFKRTKAPDCWKGESAVVLASQADYLGDFAGFQKSFVETIVLHYRILLQDKASVREFSELSFNRNSVKRSLIGKPDSFSCVAVKIIKPDGAERIIDLSSAVTTNVGSDKDSKMAVPDLNEGDIIDYFVVTQTKQKSVPRLSENDLLGEKYPVVHKQIRFILPDEVTFNSKSLRGAPEFYTSRKGRTVVYTLIDTMRAPAPKVLWDFPHRSSAEVRYRLSAAKSAMLADEALMAREALHSFDFNNADVRYIEDYLKITGKQEGTTVQGLVKEVYYLLRHPVFLKAYFNIDQGKPLDNHYVSERFFFLLDRILKRYGIEHEIMIVPSRNYGPFKELVNMNSCDLLIKVGADSLLYLARPTPFAIPGEIPYLYEGMEAVSYEYSKNKTSIRFNERIPVAGYETNLTYSRYALAFDSSDMVSVMVKRDVLARGHNKAYHQYLITTSNEYLRAYDKPNYKTFSFPELEALVYEYSYVREQAMKEEVQENFEREERMRTDIEMELEGKISNYKGLEIISLGMWDDRPDVQYSDEFVINNVVRKAGTSYILDVGKFIERQTELSEEQLARDRDIHMGYGRTFKTQITVSIPPGYSVEGIDRLNVSTISKYGGFVATAQMENGNLILNTSKFYTQNHCSAADWPEMVAFLNAAAAFSKSRILLKRE
jgi:hypothetical protein